MKLIPALSDRKLRFAEKMSLQTLEFGVSALKSRATNPRVTTSES